MKKSGNVNVFSGHDTWRLLSAVARESYNAEYDQWLHDENMASVCLDCLHVYLYKSLVLEVVEARQGLRWSTADWWAHFVVVNRLLESMNNNVGDHIDSSDVTSIGPYQRYLLHLWYLAFQLDIY